MRLGASRYTLPVHATCVGHGSSVATLLFLVVVQVISRLSGRRRADHPTLGDRRSLQCRAMVVFLGHV